MGAERPQAHALPPAGLRRCGQNPGPPSLGTTCGQGALCLPVCRSWGGSSPPEAMLLSRPRTSSQKVVCEAKGHQPGLAWPCPSAPRAGASPRCGCRDRLQTARPPGPSDDARVRQRDAPQRLLLTSHRDRSATGPPPATATCPSCHINATWRNETNQLITDLGWWCVVTHLTVPESRPGGRQAGCPSPQSEQNPDPFWPCTG